MKFRKAALLTGADQPQWDSDAQILVNNAGTGQFVPFAMMENDEYDRVMDINVRGMFFHGRSRRARAKHL